MKKGRSAPSARAKTAPSQNGGLSARLCGLSLFPDNLTTCPFGLIVAVDGGAGNRSLSVLRLSPLAQLSSDAGVEDGGVCGECRGAVSFVKRLDSAPSLSDRLCRQAALMSDSLVGGCFIAGLWAVAERGEANEDSESVASSLIETLAKQLDLRRLARAFQEARPGLEGGVGRRLGAGQSLEVESASLKKTEEDALLQQALATPFVFLALVPKSRNFSQNQDLEFWMSEGKCDSRGGSFCFEDVFQLLDFTAPDGKSLVGEAASRRSRANATRCIQQEGQVLLCSSSFAFRCCLQVEADLARSLVEAATNKAKQRLQTSLLRCLRRHLGEQGVLEGETGETPLYCMSLFAPLNSRLATKGALLPRGVSVHDALHCLEKLKKVDGEEGEKGEEKEDQRRNATDFSEGGLRLESLHPCITSVDWIVTEESLIAAEAASLAGAVEVARRAGCVDRSEKANACLLCAEDSRILALTLDLRVDAFAFVNSKASLAEALRFLVADAASVAAKQILDCLCRHSAESDSSALSVAAVQGIGTRSVVQLGSAKQLEFPEGSFRNILVLRRRNCRQAQGSEDDEEEDAASLAFLFGDGWQKPLCPLEPSLALLQQRPKEATLETDAFWKALTMTTRGGKRQKALSFRLALILLPFFAVLFRVFSDYFF